MSKRKELIGTVLSKILEELKTLPVDQIPAIHRILCEVISDYEVEERVTNLPLITVTKSKQKPIDRIPKLK